MRRCTTHHHACDCREALMQRVVDALEGMEFNWHNQANLSEKANRLLVARARTALAEWKEGA